MSGYEQKLDDFARGKIFRRLSQPIRDRADTFCDACGSNQPRILYGLKEKQSDRYFFVGANCLTELLKRCSIQRRYSKESARAAYDVEMERRAQESRTISSPDSNTTSQEGLVETVPPPPAVNVQDSTPDNWQLIPTIVIHETGDRYRVLVTLVPNHGTPWTSGGVEGALDDEISHRRLEGGVLLERITAVSYSALAESISRAWHQAKAQMSLMSEFPQGLQDLAHLSISGANNNLVNGRTSEITRAVSLVNPHRQG